MRALTITQPWTSLIAASIKLVENRPRRMIKREDFGQRFAIHASREIDLDAYGRIREIAPELFVGDDHQPWYRLSRVTSAMIAVAVIDDVIGGEPRAHVETFLAEGQRRWYFGPIGYVLRDVIALPVPVPCKGALGFWRLPSDIERAVVEQLGRSAA
jgi:hypothetical protein